MGTGLAVNLTMDPPSGFDAQQAVLDQVNELGPLVHLNWVFRVLEYTVKYSRVRTGRSRAAWFPLMDNYGFNYQRSLGGEETDPTAIAEGYAAGSYDDKPFMTVIMNNVDYVDPMNRRYGLFGFGNTVSGKMKLGSSDGIRFEEKVPLFESFGADTWNDFLNKTQQAFDGGTTIPDIEVPPPMQE